ncbi:hypothetical protein BT93_H1742 [Corymbia citriodora subsp. variegata]|nr:hypothetical protein BT93_H1742 [Corymbia citriodora subsp. variegata]
MEETSRILRRSVHTFLQNYQYFTTVSASLALPFSALFLISQAFFIPSSSSSNLLLPQLLRDHFQVLFKAAGFPTSSGFFTILGQKLSETVTSSIFTLPLTTTFLLIAKSSVIRRLAQVKVLPSHPYSLPPDLLSVYPPLLSTYVCGFLVILSANATAFFLLFFGFNCLEGFQLSASEHSLLSSVVAAIVYSMIIANTFIICNLALVLSGIDKHGGSLAIIKAYLMMRGRRATALAFAVIGNFALAATEALFRYRVLAPYHASGGFSLGILLEGCYIAYLYSVLIVLDTVLTCTFLRSCQVEELINCEDKFYCQIQILDATDGPHDTSLKNADPLLDSES